MLPRHVSYDTIIVGGGFFGSYLALDQAKHGKKVLIIEREDSLLSRASLANQARVHGGYHYPRSLVTGLRSQENYKLFANNFSDCLYDTFKHYYAISKKYSAVSAQQFRLFCGRIGAPLENAPKEIVKEFDSDYIEHVFEVQECAFDAVKLRSKIAGSLSEAQVEICTNSEAIEIKKINSSEDLIVQVRDKESPNNSAAVGGLKVFLCTYSSINQILFNSLLPQISIRNEFTEMCLVKPSGFLQNAGVTVMCGPFFSIMPYPSRELHTLSHVRYTPHFSWEEGDLHGEPGKVRFQDIPRKSRFLHMRKDAERYLPISREIQHVESIWENKTLLPRNDMDDARPILLKENHGIKNLTCIIGAKIDNVFDVCKALGR